MAREKWRRTAFLWSFFLFLSVPWKGYGQSNSMNSNLSRWSVRAALGNQTIGFPLQNLTRSFHPVLPALGIGFRLNKNPKHALSTGLTNSWTFNQEMGQLLNFSLFFEYAYRHQSGVFGGIGLDLGNSLFFHQESGYQFDQGSGEYELVPNRFTSGSSGYRLSIGYDLIPQFNKSASIFLRHRFHFQSPYFQSELFPVLPINMIELGICIHLKKRPSKS